MRIRVPMKGTVGGCFAAVPRPRASGRRARKGLVQHSRSRNRKGRAGAAGLTLVDVAVATVLLVVGLVSLADVALTLRSMGRADAERSVAANALLEQAHAIETTPFQGLIAAHDGRGFAVGIDGQAGAALRAVPGDADGLPGSISVIAPNPPNDPARLLEATVTIDWQGSFGPQRMVRRILISRLGANP
jgi:hypothetical protein